MLARRARFDSSRYLDPAGFAEEQARIFGRSWLYAGLAGEFAETPRRVETAGLAAAIARPGGGWQAEHRGRPVPVDTCGGLVFWSAAADPPALRDYLAPFHDALATMATGLATVDRVIRREVACNWKLLAENALDDYHIMTAHARTLYPSMLNAGERRVTLDRAGGHSFWRNDLSDADTGFWAKAARRLGRPAGRGNAEYRHLFIFPNFYLAGFLDTAFILHRLDPRAPDRTMMELGFCLPAEAGAPRDAMKRAVLADFALKAEAVLVEDIEVCEAAHQGQTMAVHRGVLGAREVRVGDFQDAVLEALGR